MPIEITSSQQFMNAINSGTPVIVDFYADWCGPCKQIAPTFNDLSKKCNSIYFVKVNIDNNQDLAMQCKVKSIPHFMSFKNKKSLRTYSGANVNELTNMVNELLE
jgi:thioredoxin